MAGPAKQQKPSFFGVGSDWFAERGREVARSAHELEAAGRRAWNEATRAGQDVQAATTAQLKELGARVLASEQAAKRAVGQTIVAVKKAASPGRQTSPGSTRGAQSVARPLTRSAPNPKPVGTGAGVPGDVQNSDLLERALGRWENSPKAKPWVGGGAQALGLLPGFARGGVHAVEGLGEIAGLGLRLVNPLDEWLSPPGMSARDQIEAASGRAGAYVVNSVRHPDALVRDIKQVAHKMRVDLDPTASPEGKTLAEEARRRFSIGMNEGELAFDIAAAEAGGPGAKLAGKAGRFIRKADSVERYLKRGYSLEAAKHLAGPYENGAGSHYVPQRLFKKDGPLADIPWLKDFKDSEWNVSKPEGMTRGQFYDYHYQNDPSFHGATMPRGLPEKGWSGKRMGLKKRGPVGRFWFGMPAPLKARLLGGAGTLGGAVQSISEDEDQE